MAEAAAYGGMFGVSPGHGEAEAGGQSLAGAPPSPSGEEERRVRQRSARMAAWSGGVGGRASRAVGRSMTLQEQRERERRLLFERLKRAIQRLIVQCLHLVPPPPTPTKKGKRCADPSAGIVRSC